MFTLRLHFPILECVWSNKPLALIRDKQGNVRVCKIKKVIKGEFFVTPWGWFRLRLEHANNMFKQRIFDYVTWNDNPLDIRAMKEMELFMIKTDRITLEKWIEEQDEELLSKVENESNMNLRFETDANGEIKKDKDGKPMPIAEKTKKRILRALREPVNERVETWLVNYERHEAANILTGFKEVQNLKKLLKYMSNPVTTKLPFLILLVAVLGVIGIATQAPNILDHLFAGLKSMQSGHP